MSTLIFYQEAQRTSVMGNFTWDRISIIVHQQVTKHRPLLITRRVPLRVGKIKARVDPIVRVNLEEMSHRSVAVAGCWVFESEILGVCEEFCQSRLSIEVYIGFNRDYTIFGHTGCWQRSLRQDVAEAWGYWESR